MSEDKAGSFFSPFVLRVLSAAILAPATLAATYYGGALFMALVVAAMVVMLFEWSKLTDSENFGRVWGLMGVITMAVIGATATGNLQYGFAAVFVGAIAAFIPGTSKRPFWAAVGIIYIIVPCLLLIWMRNWELGRSLTFVLFAVVWLADTGAYLAGRLIGGPRLMRSLSPEKTWSGAIGGVLLGTIGGAFIGPLIFQLPFSINLVVLGALLGVASILGDLAESAIKRYFNVKDVSQLIPGHGGFLDRLDGMIFATVTMTLALLAGMVL